MIDPKDLIEKYNALKSERSPMEAWWEELGKHCVPRKSKITTDRITGERIESTIYDSTAREAVKTMASGFMGNLTNPATMWLKLKTRNEELNRLLEVKVWLSNAVRRMLSVLANTNFYQEIHEFYLSLPTFGTAGFFTEEDEKDVVRFYARNIKELYFEENEKCEIDMVFRRVPMTARQAYLRWKEKAGQNILDALEAKKDITKQYEFIHVIGPRGERDTSKIDSKNKPFFSVWINCEIKKTVAESGFDEFPLPVGRFNKEDEIKYGFGPAMDVLPDIKSANEIKKIILRAGAKQGDPPIVLPHDGYILPLDMNASGINFKQKGFGVGDEKIEFLRPEADLSALQKLLEDDQETIRKAFFVDLFKALELRSERMTATEVSERVQEAMVLLGPAVSRIISGVLRPTIERLFNIMLRRGLFDDLPEQLEGVPIDIVYQSRLEVAQKFGELQSVNSFLQGVAGLAQFKPESLDKVSADEAVNLLAEFTGVDTVILESDDVVMAIRESRKQAAQQQQDMMAAQAGGMVAKDAGAGAKLFAQAQGMTGEE